MDPKSKTKSVVNKRSNEEDKNSVKVNESVSVTKPVDEPEVSDQEKSENKESADDSITPYECPVCLQNYSYAVQLPCKHVFCFLCVKGVAHRSKRCALCRQEIPVDFFNDPKLVRNEDLSQSVAFDEGYQWFYEGRNGWWQYDDRISVELETRYKQGDKVFELLIAGFLYIIDLENMMQYRRNDRTRKRRMRRDLHTIPGIKGVAGLKFSPGDAASSSSRPGGDGLDNAQTASNSNQNMTSNVVSMPPPIIDSNTGLGDHDSYLSPPAPNNTPQTPQTPADSPPNSVSSSQQDLSAHLQNLQLTGDDSSPNQSAPQSSENSPRNLSTQTQRSRYAYMQSELVASTEYVDSSESEGD